MSLQAQLSVLTGRAFAHLGLDPELGDVVPSQRPELGQFQCNGAMSAARVAGKPPIEIANSVVRQLLTYPEVERAEMAPPGFVNVSVTDGTLAEWANRTTADPRLGHTSPQQPMTVVVDYGGPNVAKAMHVGHLRATIIGDSLARLFAFAGHKVIRDPHFGDWGFQMGLLITAVSEMGIDPGGITLEDLQTIYPEVVARARDDGEFADMAREATVRLQRGDSEARAVWEAMKTVSETSQRGDFASLGVSFDLWYGESDVQKLIQPMVEKLREAGVAVESEGALVVDVEQPGDRREWPPLILESKAGGFLYSTTDLATILMRVEELGADLILYVVDRRQGDHFTQVFRASRKGGIAPEAVGLEHIEFGTMNGPDGKPFKTREGGVVRLGDVITMVKNAAEVRLDEAHLAEEYPEEERTRIAAQVGVASLKFGDLINNRSSDYVFDLERFSAFEGKTGPYLQYAAVRIKSILRKAGERDIEAGAILAPTVEAERSLVLALLRLPEVIDRAIELRAPNHAADYAYQVAGEFNRFYDFCHILSEEDADRRGSWISLSQWALSTLELLLELLGIEVPDRM